MQAGVREKGSILWCNIQKLSSRPKYLFSSCSEFHLLKAHSWCIVYGIYTWAKEIGSRLLFPMAWPTVECLGVNPKLWSQFETTLKSHAGFRASQDCLKLNCLAGQLFPLDTFLPFLPSSLPYRCISQEGLPLLTCMHLPSLFPGNSCKLMDPGWSWKQSLKWNCKDGLFNDRLALRPPSLVLDGMW